MRDRINDSAYGQVIPSADAYTNTGSYGTNYGTNALLNVQSGSQVTYIQFNLGSVPPGYTGANVAKATLKLFVNAMTTAGNFNVQYVNSAWSEATITAKSSPALGSTIVSAVALASGNVDGYVLVDITSALQARLNGTQANNGIALVGNSPLNASFQSTLLLRLKRASGSPLTFISDAHDVSTLPGWVKTPKQISDGHLSQLAAAHGVMLATLDESIAGSFVIPR